MTTMPIVYNYFRDYDPATGRYVESDPTGLRYSLNTYAYLDAQPLDGVDPLGLGRATGRPRPSHFHWTYGGCIATACLYKDSDKPVADRSVPLLFYIGGGFQFCTSPDEPTSPCENPKNKKDEPIDINLGLGRYLGIILSGDGKACINFGLGVSPPISLDLPAGTFGY